MKYLCDRKQSKPLYVKIIIIDLIGLKKRHHRKINGW